MADTKEQLFSLETLNENEEWERTHYLNYQELEDQVCGNIFGVKRGLPAKTLVETFNLHFEEKNWRVRYA